MIEDRYSRQQGLTENFEQAALEGAAVLIVGVGGLGTHVATSLVSAGIGTVILCDHDTVALSNLNRQPLYNESDIGQKKVTVAAKKLGELNPHPQIITCDKAFAVKHFEGQESPHLIIDCLDNLDGRRELIGYATSHNIPLIHGAVEAMSGQISVYLPNESACPLCGLSEIVEEDASSPSSLGSCVSLTAALQATEAIKLLTTSGTLCTNAILVFDALTGCFDKISIERDHHCLACSTKRP